MTRFFVVLLVACFAALPAAAQDSKDKPSEPPAGAAPAQQSTVAEPLVMLHGSSPVYPEAARQEGIQGKVWVQLHISESGDVESVEPISGEPVLVDAVTRAVKKWKFKPYLKDGKPVKVTTKRSFDFFFHGKGKDLGANSGCDAPLPPEKPPVTPGDAPKVTRLETPDRVRISAGTSQGLLCHRITPIYPVEARQMHIEGTVVLRAVIAKDGHIKDLAVVSGPKQLQQAAMGAVEQWRYRPYFLKGQPVEVDTQITVNFTLR